MTTIAEKLPYDRKVFCGREEIIAKDYYIPPSYFKDLQETDILETTSEKSGFYPSFQIN